MKRSKRRAKKAPPIEPAIRYEIERWCRTPAKDRADPLSWWEASNRLDEDVQSGLQFIRTAFDKNANRTDGQKDFETDFQVTAKKWRELGLNLFVLYYIAAHRGTIKASSPASWLNAIVRLRRLHRRGKLALLGQAARLIRDEILPYERTRKRKGPYTPDDIEACILGLGTIERTLILDLECAKKLGYLPKRGGQPHSGRMGMADYLPDYFSQISGAPRPELCCQVGRVLGIDLTLQQQQQDRRTLKKRKLGPVDNPLVSLDRGLR